MIAKEGEGREGGAREEDATTGKSPNLASLLTDYDTYNSSQSGV